MPTYEYRCDTCGTVIEAVQGFHDAPLRECPNCHGALRKLFGNVGVVFKGSGFYRNDARAEGKPASKGASQPKKSSDSAGTSDSKAPAPSADKPSASAKDSKAS